MPTLLVWWILVFLSGCAYEGPVADPNVPLAPASDWESNTTFQKVLSSAPGTRDREVARIDYLLERVKNSPYNFIRNGSRYTGKRAEAHLRWKYFRNRKRIKTAEDFLNEVATRSKMTGQSYEVVFPNKIRLPLHVLLRRELEEFDREVEAGRGRGSPEELTL